MSDKAKKPKRKTLAQRVKELEDVVNEFCGTSLSEWVEEVETEPKPYRQDDWQPGEK